MSQLLRYFPLGDIGRMGWPTNLIVWMQDVHRAVSGDYNVIHLAKGSTTTDDIGGASGATSPTQIVWDDELVKQPGFVHSNTDSPSKVVVDNDGRYSVIATICAVNGASAWVHMKAYIKKNSAEYFYGSTAYDYAIGSSWRVNLKIVTEIQLYAGDYIEVETYVQLTQSGQAVTTIPAECELIVRRMA